MPDLMPNTSIYPRPPQQQPMSLGDLIGVAKGIQGLQSQQSLADALRKNADPNSPSGVNMPAARADYLANAPLADPSQLTAMTGAESSGFDLRMAQFKTLYDGISSIAADKKVTKDTLYQYAPVLSRAAKGLGLPPDMISNAIAGLPNDPKAIQDWAVGVQGWLGGLARAPGVPGTPLSTGEQTLISPTEQQRQIRQIGGGAPGPGTASAGTTAPPGSGMITSQPEGYSANVLGQTGAIGALRDNFTNIAQRQADLENLRDISKEAATGPTAGFEERANQLWQRFFPGSTLSLTPEQLSKTEEFAKIGEQIAGQQAVAGHATNAFLQNAYGANPHLGLSKLGREGIINMLLGNTDAQRTLWGEWLKSGKKPAEFDKWLQDFNKNFDPRVFQYERMSPDQQKTFLEIIQKNGTKGELGRFTKRLQDYEQRGWIGNAAQ